MAVYYKNHSNVATYPDNYIHAVLHFFLIYIYKSFNICIKDIKYNMGFFFKLFCIDRSTEIKVCKLFVFVKYFLVVSEMLVF